MTFNATGYPEQKRQSYREWCSYSKTASIFPNISSICKKPSIWSLLPRTLCVHDKLNNESYYWNYAHQDFDHRLVTYISLAFPYKQEKDSYPWGIAWTSMTTAEGLACGFISMLPSGWVPIDTLDFFRLFLEALHQEWKATCSNANARVEVLVSPLNSIISSESNMKLIHADLFTSDMIKSKSVVEVTV
jgi:hypothetical protein